jgi:hypothetical protein
LEYPLAALGGPKMPLSTIAVSVVSYSSEWAMTDKPRSFDPYFEYLGRIVSSYSILDFCADRILWQLAEVKPILGAAITSQIPSIHTKCRAIIAILTLLDGSKEFIDEINRFNADVRHIIETRNRLVHDAWVKAPNTGPGQFRETIIGKNIHYGFTEGDLKAMDKAYLEILNYVTRLDAIRKKIDAWLSASPRKWLQPLSDIPSRPRTSMKDH